MIGERLGEFFHNMKEYLPIKKSKEERPTVDSLVNEFVYGNQLGVEEFLSNIDVSDIHLLQESVRNLDQAADKGEVTDRRVVFKLNQLKNLVESGDLEIAIRRSKGENIIERWN